jgi:hypothetical protein
VAFLSVDDGSTAQVGAAHMRPRRPRPARRAGCWRSAGRARGRNRPPTPPARMNIVRRMSPREQIRHEVFAAGSCFSDPARDVSGISLGPAADRARYRRRDLSRRSASTQAAARKMRVGARRKAKGPRLRGPFDVVGGHAKDIAGDGGRQLRMRLCGSSVHAPHSCRLMGIGPGLDGSTRPNSSA